MSQFFVKKTDGTWENIGGNGYGTWAALTADLPEDTDWDSFGLRIFVNSDGFAKGAKLYIDSLCIGTREKDMYAYTSGTSMAAPQAAGAAALMTAAHPDESPEQIRARVIGSVTPVDAFKDLSATGGLLDLSVKEEDYGPTVTAATADTQSAVLTGYYFGNDAGSISAVVTKNGITKNCDVGITSWTDREVHLTFKEKAEGVVSFTLTKANNKSFRIRTEVAGSDRKWKELALPAGIDNYESDGLLSALGDKIYYLPYRTGNNIKYVDKMYIYDISANKWSKGPKVPNMLGNASAAVYKGKVYVRGNQLDSYDGLLLESGIYPVYSYNPAKGKWMKNADAEGLNTSVLATYNDNLVLVGTEAVKEGDVLQYLSGSEIRKYNPKKGTGKKIAGLKTPVTSGCKTAALNGKLYIFSYVEYDDRVGDKKPLYSFQELAGNKVKDLSMALPIRYEGTSINGLQDVSRAELVHGNKGIDGYSLLSVNDKIVLFGRDDVYKSRNSWAYTPGEEFFSELEEQMCDDQLLMSRAVPVGNKIYSFVLPMNPSNNHFRLFDADALVKPATQKNEVTKAERTAAKNELNTGLKAGRTGNKVKVKWGGVSKADKYVVYAAYCGSGKPAKIKAVKGGITSVTFKKLSGKKLDLSKKIKVYVVAYGKVNGKETKLARSNTAYIGGKENGDAS